MIYLFVLIAVIYGMSWSIMDDIKDHNKYSHWGFYWSKVAYENKKESLLDMIFPMFKDGWHLLQVIRNLCPAFALWIASGDWVLGASWLFIILVSFVLTYNHE